MVSIFLTFVALSIAIPAAAQDRLPEAVGANVIQRGDILRVSIWREPDLSGDFLVDEAGRVNLPLIGEIQIQGMPPEDARDLMLRVYRSELRNPSIVITPLRRIYIFGEVNMPGLKTLDPTLTLAGAISLAGGANTQGDLNRIRIVREGRVIQSSVPATSGLADINLRSGDQIFVGRRSWFERNSTFVVSALLSVTSIIITLAK